MPMLRRDSFTLLRETMRWRVSIVLAGLILVLTLTLGILNTRLQLPDTALLAWICAGIAAGCIAALLLLPRHVGGTVFFVTIALLLVGTMAFGWWYGRGMQHWAYIFPPVVVFLLRARYALLAMLLFGAYTTVLAAQMLPGIDVVRFASGYGLLVCFMFTYALLQEGAAEMLRYHSDHDALSNCLNRRTFNETLEQLGGSRSLVRRCVFLLIDIDHFKAINDQHGHLVGDRVITQVAAELGRVLDADMPLFRYGGEEFAVMTGDLDLAGGLALGEKLRAAVSGADFQGIPVTVSIGVAEWQRGQGSTAMALDRADRALYDAKRGGRDRVAVDAAAAGTAAIPA
jgi:diguanylate cyclase (GGDEF)-like protein